MPTKVDPDQSPFCVKIEAFLRLAKITDYDVVPVEKHQMRKSPTHKMPSAWGGPFKEPISDSRYIIEGLVAAGVAPDLDAHLSKRDRAIAEGVRCLLEDSLYFAIMYARWKVDDQFWNVLIPSYFGNMPALLGKVFACFIRREMLSALHGHGIGRHSMEKVTARAIGELDALSELLGDQPFLFGDMPSTVDATLYGTMTILMQGDWSHPINDAAREHKNLAAYYYRLHDQLFPELEKPSLRS